MTRGRLRSLWVAGLIAGLIGAVAPTAHAQSAKCGTNTPEVALLRIEGNRAFSTEVLKGGIYTTPSTWWRRNIRVFSTARCLDRPEFTLDVFRLLKWYRNHGFLDATVDTAVTPYGPGRVAVRFSLHEGAPMLVDSLAFAGLDAVPERDALLRGLATKAGSPFDRYANEATRDTLTRRLHNGGYPDAEVFLWDDTRLLERRASVTFIVATGPRARFGALDVHITPRAGTRQAVTERAVRNVASVRLGGLYSEQELERAKRALYRTEAFSFVKVTPESTTTAGDSTIRVRLDLTEGQMHSVRAGAGWGTLDCFRASADLTKYNLLSGATRLDVRSRVSKLGVGKPVTGLESVCPQAKSDVYSTDINYSVNATVSAAALYRGFVPSLTLFSERRSEYNAFLRSTPVGGSIAFNRGVSRLAQSVSYTVEYGRTEAQPALLCAVFNACAEVDQRSYGQYRRLAVVSYALTREASDNPVNPTRGSVLRAEFRTAGKYTGSDDSLRFNKLLGDGSFYVPLSRNVVLAMRLRFGAVIGSNLSFSNATVRVPAQERLFGGGPTTVRGFRQNELGPAVYIPFAYDTVRANGIRGGDPANPGDTVYFRADTGRVRIVPTGGNALVVANIEARMRSPLFPDLLQWTAFADLGEVWNRGAPGATLGVKSVLVTPGVGVRVSTLIGYLRVDVAHNPYQRPAGAAYFDAPLSQGGALFCVSPGNTLRVTSTSDGRLTQESGGSCPGTFQPAREMSFLSRLTFSFSIGQAF